MLLFFFQRILLIILLLSSIISCKTRRVNSENLQENIPVDSVDSVNPVSLSLFDPQNFVGAAAKGDIQALNKALNSLPESTSKSEVLQFIAEQAGINNQTSIIDFVQHQLISLNPADQNLIIQKMLIGAIKGGHNSLVEDLIRVYGVEHLTKDVLQFAGNRPNLSTNFPNAPQWGTEKEYQETLDFLSQKVKDDSEKMQVFEEAKSKERPFVTDFMNVYISSIEDSQYQKLLEDVQQIRENIPPNMRTMFQVPSGKYQDLAKTMDMKVWMTIDGEGTVHVFNPDELKMVEVGANAEGKLVFKNGPAKGMLMNEFAAKAKLALKDIEWMYVVDTNGRMFVINRQNGQFHSSLAGGRPVVAAGTLKFNTLGDLVQITEDSGHYKFKDHIVIPYIEMQAMGVNLSKVQIAASEYARLSPNDRMLRVVCNQTIKKIQIESANKSQGPLKRQPPRPVKNSPPKPVEQVHPVPSKVPEENLRLHR